MIGRRWFRWLFAFCLCLTVAQTFAAGPLQSGNQGPMAGLFGLPGLVRFEHDPQTSVFARLSVANNFLPRSSEREVLLLDGETLRLETGYGRRLNHCWSGAVLVPFLEHSGGNLDSFLNDWHRIFDLPESGRPLAPSDRLLYFYQIDDENILNLTGRHAGLGDIRLMLALQPGCGFSDKLLLRGGLKLPTGDPDKLLGSGGADVFIDISRQSGELWPGGRVSGTAGLLAMQQSELFPNQRDAVLYAAGGFSWQFSPLIAFEAQLSTHSGFFRSDLKEPDGWSLQIIIGAQFRLSESLALELMLSEDPVYGTSPDVVFQSGLQMRF